MNTYGLLRHRIVRGILLVGQGRRNALSYSLRRRCGMHMMRVMWFLAMNIRWLLLAGGCGCLWVALGPWAAAGAVLVSLAIMYDMHKWY